MHKEKRSASPVMHGLIIFLTLGIALSNEVVTRLGIDGSFVWMFSIALLIAAILVEQNKVMVATIVFGVVAINLPEATFTRYGIDSDVILAAVCATIVLPALWQILLE